MSRYLVTYGWSLGDDAAWGAECLTRSEKTGVRQGVACFERLYRDWGSCLDSDDYIRVDVYDTGEDYEDPDAAFDAYGPTYDGDDGDVLHMDLSARGLSAMIYGAPLRFDGARISWR